MEQSNSRLGQELQTWREREQRYQTLFSPSVLKSREFLKEKLKHYDEIRARVISNPISEDKVALRAFQLERAQLARQVYPNIFVRLIERLVSVLRVNNNIVKVQKERIANDFDIQLSMQKVGLGSHYNKAQQQMRRGEKEFSLPVSYHVKEGEKMELELRFKKDDAGRYHFENYKATLHAEHEKIKARQHTFDVRQENGINLNTAYNLLAGRAVQNADGWKQLDLNDKDGAGNLRLRHFADNYGFDIEKALCGLPIKETERMDLLQRLKDGNMVEAKLQVNNKEVVCLLCTSPLKKEIAVYNQEGEKTSLQELKEGPAQPKIVGNVKQLVPKVESLKEPSKSRSVKL